MTRVYILALFGAAITLIYIGFMQIGGVSLAPSVLGYTLTVTQIFAGIVIADIAYWLSAHRTAGKAAIK